MNSIPLALECLDRLITMAIQARTDFEKAAVYAATSALVTDLDEDFQAASDLGDKLEEIRWKVCALVGYDVTNGMRADVLASGARGALIILKYRCRE